MLQTSTPRLFDEEDVGKFGDVEMHEIATHTFQGMSNEVQSDKLDEEQDTTTGAHEGVNDRKEEPYHEVLPDQQDVDKDNPDKDQQDIDKDQQDSRTKTRTSRLETSRMGTRTNRMETSRMETRTSRGK